MGGQPPAASLFLGESSRTALPSATPGARLSAAGPFLPVAVLMVGFGGQPPLRYCGRCGARRRGRPMVGLGGRGQVGGKETFGGVSGVISSLPPSVRAAAQGAR